jgi:branched-chain amino acid transport system substrate-binding protein
MKSSGAGVSDRAADRNQSQKDVLMKFPIRLTVVAAVAVAAVSSAHAEIAIGMTLGTTGPTASAGIPYWKIFTHLPEIVAGQPVKYILFDDAGDPTSAVRNARKLIGEDNVDLLIASTSTPTCLAVVDVAVENKIPQICMSPIVVPEQKQSWVFTVPQRVSVMFSAVVEDMKAKGVKSIGYIGFTDGWGDICLQTIEKLASDAGIKVVARERYNRADTTVTAQALRIMAARPDAVFVGASVSPAALPHIALRDHGFAGPIYHTHGIIGPDFLRVGGNSVEGAIAPSGPLVVVDQLPDGSAMKQVSLAFIKQYEPTYPEVRNSFAGYAYDTFLLIQAAIPGALAKSIAGTPEFRRAMRDSLENVKEVVGTQAVYTMSPQDHNGVDERARVLVQVKDGNFTLMH